MPLAPVVLHFSSEAEVTPCIEPSCTKSQLSETHIAADPTIA